MKIAERIVGIVGGLASIITLVDVYLIKGAVADALALPPQVPTAYVVFLIVILAALLIFNARRERRMGALETENAALERKLRDALSSHEETQAQLEQARSQTTKYENLPEKVYATLLRRDASVQELARELQLDTSGHHALMGAIATLVTEGKIGRGALSSDYGISRR